MAKKIVTKKATTKKPAAKKAPSSGDKMKFLKGEVCCLSGKFSYYPEKPELLKFLKAQGAKVVEKVTNDVTILIVGEGKKSAKEKSAEALNNAGGSIRIIKPTGLGQTITPEIPAMILDPNTIQAAEALLNTYWLFRHQGIEIKGEEFSKISIGKKLKADLTINHISFANCLFKNCTWTNIAFGYANTSSQNCVFESNVFNQLYLWELKNCTITKATGTLLKLNILDRCEISDCNFDDAKFEEFQNTKVSNCTSKELELGGTHRNSTFTKMTANEVAFFQTRFEKCELKDVNLSKIVEKEDPIRFEKCKLTNVQFKNAKVLEMIFEDCELTNCSFDGVEGQLLDLRDSKVSKCKFVGSKFAGMHVTAKQQKSFVGIDSSHVITDLSKFKEVNRLAQTMLKSDKIEFSFDGPMDTGDLVNVNVHLDYKYNFSFAANKDKEHCATTNVHKWAKIKIADIVRKLAWVFKSAKFTEVNLGSIKLKTSKCPLKPKDMKQLIAAAAYEAIGKEAKSEAELKEAEKTAKANSKEAREAVIAELQANQIAKVNRRTIAELKSCCPFRKVDLKGKNLKGAKFSDLVFEECDFTDADLSKAQFTEANFRKSKFVGAKLSGADLKNAKMRNVDLTNADLSNAKLLSTDLTGAKLTNVNFSKAKFGQSTKRWLGNSINLKGLDLSTANFKGAKMGYARYDEKTILPKSMTKTQLKEMEWDGGGIPPHERKQNKKVDGPLDFESFMERLKEITDSSRLAKSTKMLKANSFELFTEIKPESVVGIVRSQSDKELVYSCTLNAEGKFACCTQNLNTCGGLRGAICKHILVLMIGLTKSGELNAADVDQWINDSKMKQPELDKDLMSEVLLKYKGAEAGEIDWRPTETVPEDFFAF